METATIYYSTPTRMAKVKKTDNIKCWQNDVEQPEFSHTFGESVSWPEEHQHLKLNTDTRSPTPRGVCVQHTKGLVQENTEALFKGIKTWKQPKGPSTVESTIK